MNGARQLSHLHRHRGTPYLGIVELRKVLHIKFMLSQLVSEQSVFCEPIFSMIALLMFTLPKVSREPHHHVLYDALKMRNTEPVIIH